VGEGLEPPSNLEQGSHGAKWPREAETPGIQLIRLDLEVLPHDFCQARGSLLRLVLTSAPWVTANVEWLWMSPRPIGSSRVSHYDLQLPSVDQSSLSDKRRLPDSLTVLAREGHGRWDS
jgi:hypothetical protein